MRYRVCLLFYRPSLIYHDIEKKNDENYGTTKWVEIFFHTKKVSGFIKGVKEQRSQINKKGVLKGFTKKHVGFIRVSNVVCYLKLIYRIY